MSSRFIARRGFRYPVGDSLAVVRAAGGLSKLTDEQRAALTFKRVEPGEPCDDMPAESLALRLARGEVDEIPAAEDAAPARREHVPTIESEA